MTAESVAIGTEIGRAISRRKPHLRIPNPAAHGHAVLRRLLQSQSFKNRSRYLKDQAFLCWLLE
jgi:hypothetical protein